MTSSTRLSSFLERIHFPTSSGIGLISVVLFVIGDGIEAVWITDYLHTDIGYTSAQASGVYTCYGIVVAIAAFCSGALCDAIGPKRVMLIGLVSFLVFDALFITVGLPSGHLALLMLFYGLRGFGYPMLAYGFLTWMMLVTPAARQSSASGWFWFAFSLGMQTIGAWLSSLLLPLTGGIATLWVGWALAAVGGGCTLWFLHNAPKSSETKGLSVLAALRSGTSIVWRRRKVCIGGIIKVINLAGQYGLQAYYLIYISQVHHMDRSVAISEFTIFGLACIIGDVAWGIAGDRIGWHRTLRAFATPLCALSLAYLYLIPFVTGPNVAIVALGMIGMGIGLSAHVPTTPLIMAHAAPETANALAILNLGAGLGAFVGPAIVTLLINSAGSYAAVAFNLAGLYVISWILLSFMRHPSDPLEVRRRLARSSATK